ncbi:hypothetical protein [Streptacidiphilus rugosus]|uniref:hypothetical protein n=1 Tax=Streptacidiphilus rugosus TaxID=405783 RepID=UPI00056C1C9F|nr:hypothetical protein [Streptacidiphilus rugosus]
MNLRTVTRGDAALAASALLLFVSSFLTFYAAGGVQCTAVGGVPSGCTSTNAWSLDLFPLLPSVFFLGIIGAGLVLVDRNVPKAPAVLGIPLRAWGTVLTVASAWSALWALFGSPSGALFGHPDATSSPQVGAFLAFVFAVLTAVLAIAGPLVPLLTAPLLPEPAPAGVGSAAAQGYGAPQQGHPHLGHFGGQPVQQAHPGQPFTGPEPVPAEPFPAPAATPAATPAPAAAARPEPKPEPQDEPPTVPATLPLGSRTPPPAAAEPPAPSFAPFWFAVPAARPLAPEGEPQGTPVGELVPGTWYLAIAQRGEALLTQTQEGKRGLLADTSGIQRG